MSEQIPAAPYYVVPHPDHWTIQTREGGAGAPVAMQYCGSSSETAQFIVRACNAHDELVAALRMARTYVCNEGTDEEIYQLDEALAAAGAA